ncbi:MAG: hypothetical protein K2L99_03345, partial [Muribaculaceae bacterium]|nr:hypothetical protein [Muribaculaceae bacterium]
MSAEGKKQVLFIIDSLGHGGAEKSLVSLLRHLDYSRMDVDLFVRSSGGVYESSIPAQVNLVDYSPKGLRRMCCNALHSLAVRLNGKERHGAETEWRATGTLYPVPRKKYDVAIAYQQGVPTFMVSKKIKASRKIAWVNADLAAAGYDSGYCKDFYAAVDRVVGVSEVLSRKIAADGYADESKVVTIYDIIDTSAIYSAAREHCHMTPLPDGTLRIVTVARLSSPKNHLLAVQTAAILKRRRLDYLWHFVGDGPEHEAVAQAIRHEGLDK